MTPPPLSAPPPAPADTPGWDLELDCRGMRCPAPIIELARHHTEVEVGATVGVVATDVAARVDVPAWCRMREQEYVGESAADDGTPVYVVRRLA